MATATKKAVKSAKSKSGTKPAKSGSKGSKSETKSSKSVSKPKLSETERSLLKLDDLMKNASRPEKTLQTIINVHVVGVDRRPLRALIMFQYLGKEIPISECTLDRVEDALRKRYGVILGTQPEKEAVNDHFDSLEQQAIEKYGEDNLEKGIIDVTDNTPEVIPPVAKVTESLQVNDELTALLQGAKTFDDLTAIVSQASAANCHLISKKGTLIGEFTKQDTAAGTPEAITYQKNRGIYVNLLKRYFVVAHK